jgi:hypothetical protein
MNGIVETIGNQYALCRVNTLVKTGKSFIHTLVFSMNDPAPTAGSINIFDNTSATGTPIYSETFTTAVFRGYTIVLDIEVQNGIYVAFTTTADVNCVVTFK